MTEKKSAMHVKKEEVEMGKEVPMEQTENETNDCKEEPMAVAVPLAEQFREVSERSQAGPEIYKELTEHAFQSAQKGVTFITVFELRNENLINMFTNEGFKVNKITDKNLGDTLTRISW